MSSLIANGSARRLLCHTCRQKHSIIASEWTAHASGFRASWKRSYATKPGYHVKYMPRDGTQTSSPPTTPKPSSPSQSRTPKLSAKRIPGAEAEPQQEPARLIFSPTDVLPLADWASSLENLGNHDLKAMECVEGARRYVSIVTQYESMWRGELEDEHQISPYLLHWMGISLLCGNTASRWRLGTHMLRSASELDYTPSTITLVRIFRTIPAEKFEQAAKSKLYKAANARFKAIVREGADPDALTMQGLTYANAGGKKKALDMFRRATKAWEEPGQRKESSDAVDLGAKEPKAPAAVRSPGIDGLHDSSEAGRAAEADNYVLPEPREPRWAWEVSCVMGQADILHSQGDAREAERLYRVAAVELDNPRAFLQLAKLMDGPRDSPERRTYLLKAAVSGELDACREMGKLETMAAAQEGLSDKERAEHNMIGKEWFRLADGKDLAAIKAGDVGDVK